MNGARYTHLTPDEVAALTPPARTAYEAQRRAFDREVEHHRAALADGRGIDVRMPSGRPDVIRTPITLTNRGRRP